MPANVKNLKSLADESGRVTRQTLSNWVKFEGAMPYWIPEIETKEDGQGGSLPILVNPDHLEFVLNCRRSDRDKPSFVWVFDRIIEKSKVLEMKIQKLSNFERATYLESEKDSGKIHERSHSWMSEADMPDIAEELDSIRNANLTLYKAAKFVGMTTREFTIHLEAGRIKRHKFGFSVPELAEFAMAQGLFMCVIHYFDESPSDEDLEHPQVEHYHIRYPTGITCNGIFVGTKLTNSDTYDSKLCFVSEASFLEVLIEIAIGANSEEIIETHNLIKDRQPKQK